MAFYNCFMNFNLNIRPMSFNFSFGCFSMPNFFSCAPRFNLFSNPMAFFQRYNTPLMNNFPSLHSGFSNFSYINNSYTNIFTNSIDYNFNYGDYLNGFDTFDRTIKPPKKEVITKKEFEYTSSKDKFATNNNKYFAGLTPEMQTKTKKLIAYANEAGYDIKITSGKRTEAEQKALVERDKANGTKLAASKNSPHLQGIAIDIEVYKDGKKLKDEFPDLTNYAKNELGFRWGGDFVNWTKEPWHFDLRRA